MVYRKVGYDCDYCNKSKKSYYLHGHLYDIITNRNNCGAINMCCGCVNDSYDNKIMIQVDYDDEIRLIITEYTTWSNFKLLLQYDTRGEDSKLYLRNEFIRGINEQIELLNDETDVDEIEYYNEYILDMVGSTNNERFNNIMELYDGFDDIPPIYNNIHYITNEEVEESENEDVDLENDNKDWWE